MLSGQTDKILEQLISLGLDATSAEIYLYLARNKSCTPLQISKDLRIARTRVYRILDNLVHKKLALQVLGDRGMQFEIQPLVNLELLLVEKETELETFKRSLPIIEEELQRLNSTNNHKSKVVYFHGKAGLEQVTWNSTKAKGVLRIYEISENMGAFLTQTFSEKVRKEFLENKVKIRQLTNLNQIGDHTKVTELVQKYWEVRFIDKKKLNIKFETLVYNDVVALYTYKGGEMFCVEVHNPYLAQMQIQLFDFVWVTAQKMKIVSPYGAARLIRKSQT